MQLYSSTFNRKHALLTTSYLHTEPTSYNQAKYLKEWCSAMHDEIRALHSNKTWSLVPRPSSKNVVSKKWFFRIKQKPYGNIERYKACLVAKGYT